MAPVELRVVQVFSGVPIEERRFAARPGMAVSVGTTSSAHFVVAATLGAQPRALFEYGVAGFQVAIAPGMRGTLHLQGSTLPVAGERSASLPIGRGDWGIVALDAPGETAFFFQLDEAGPRLRPPLGVDGFFASGLGVAIFVHLAILIAALLFTLKPGDDDLAAAPDRLARLVLDEATVRRAAEERARKTHDEPKVKAEDMSKRAKGKEGRFGDARSPLKESRLAKGSRDVIADKVRDTGLLREASRARGDTAFGRLLQTDHGGDLTMALNGVKGARSEIGQGAGGLGTRGNGTGGGGTGAGQIRGIGNMEVGGGGNARNHHAGGGAGRVAKELGVQVSQAGASTDGSLSRDQIYKVVASHLSAVQFCFEKELQRFPHLTGKVVLGWRVELDGTVSGARVDTSTLAHPPTEGCMVRQLKGWTFPKPAGTVAQVTFPFLFRGQ